MITYSMSGPEVHREIVAAVPDWESRVAALQAEVGRGKTSRAARLWKKAKEVLLDAQGRKCAYCERALSSRGSDVEHFRPKGRIFRWPPRTASAEVRRRWRAETVGELSTVGYRHLVLDSGNLLVACMECNSRFKRNYFPVAGQRALGRDALLHLGDEGAYLPNPRDRARDAPAKVLGFSGAWVVPVGRDADFMKRGRLTIDLFDLNRYQMLRERAARIVSWFDAKASIRSSLTGNRAPTATCTRAFAEVARSDPVQAREFYEQAEKLVDGWR